MSSAAIDLTKEWRALVGVVRVQLSSSTSGASGRSTGVLWGVSSAEAAATAAEFASPWRTPLTPFMQQATELNDSIKEMHTFLLQHFHDYIDLHHSLPSQRSVMSDEDKDIIDLEVTSFMTACAAGVDALKALLQRERLRRLEASASNGGVGNGAGIDNGGVAGGGMRPGSRPAHENVAVTFLFERLKAVTEVAETMQTERNKRTVEQKARFYAGPATRSRTASEAAAAATPASAIAATGDVWRPTPEELEEERLFEESLMRPSLGIAERPNSAKVLGTGHSGVMVPPGAAEATTPSPISTSTRESSSLSLSSSRPQPALESLPHAAISALSTTGFVGMNSGSAALDRRRQPLNNDGSAAFDERASEAAAERGRGREDGRRYRGGGVGGRGLGTWGDDGAENSGGPLVSSDALQAENADLVARYQNELDDARLVETKMSEISGLMGLFASKVVEQQGGMEHVFDAAVSANDKLVSGGQHLEKAVERGGAFRMFYSWFMIGASFCLLFLHFYRT